MRRKITSIITALSMCATMVFMPITASATLKDDVIAAFDTLADVNGEFAIGSTTFKKDTVNNYINVYQSNTIDGQTFTEVLVDTNIEGKTGVVASTSPYGDTTAEQTVNNRSAFADFTLRTTMYMQNVATIYNDYMALANTYFVNVVPGISVSELNGTKVKGEFTINVKLPTGLIIADDVMKQSNQDMYGLSFVDGTPITKLYREVSRVYSSDATGETLNITIVPCDPQPGGDTEFAHKATLDTYLNKNIQIECPVKAAAPQSGNSITYTAEGYVNGWTEIYSAANDRLAKVEYKANQQNVAGEVADAVLPNIILTEDVKVNYQEPSSPGGGGVTSYKLTFETNGGSAITAIFKNKGTVIDLTPYTTVKDGYKFEGWYLDKELTKPVDKVTLNSNMTVYAKWSEVSEDKVTLTFVTNGGSTVSPVTTDKGTVVNINDYITLREGYTFEGWYLDESLTTPVDTLTLNVDTTVYAKWSQTPRPSQLTDEHYAYIIGRTDGLVHPAANITRAEVATIFFRLLTAQVRDGNLTKENQFDDVNEDDWFCAAVSTLEDLGIINGRTDTTFVPNAFITRAEYAAIASRFSDVVYNGKSKFSDIANHWAEGEINEASHVGWIIGDGGKFRPDDYITRAEAMTLTNRVLKRIPEVTDDLLDNMVKWPDNMDTTMWYYLAVQEATNSHDYKLKADNVHEKWTTIEAPRDWTEYEK